MASESKENKVVDGRNTMATEKVGLPCFPYIIILFSSENNRKNISTSTGQIQLSKRVFPETFHNTKMIILSTSFYLGH